MKTDGPRATARCVRFILQKRASLRLQDRIPWIWDHASPSRRSKITNMDAQKSWWYFRIPSQATLRLITACFVSSNFFIHSLDGCSLLIIGNSLAGTKTESGQHSAAPLQGSKGNRDAYKQTANGRTWNFKKGFDALLVWNLSPSRTRHGTTQNIMRILYRTLDGWYVRGTTYIQ